MSEQEHQPNEHAGVTPGAADEGGAASERTDRYTMAEAARLKGVSYHTVSRAVRRGKLPAHRLGRMALITADDLRAWRPMRERAPKKYRSREPAPDATPALLDLASGERVDLARRLSTLYEVIHTAAVERSLPEFAALLCDRFAETLELSRVVIWQIDDELGIGTRIAKRGPSMSTLPDQVPLATLPDFLHRAAGGKAQIVEDIRAEVPGLENYVGERGLSALFAAPLRLNGHGLGVILGDRGGAPFSLTADQLALAQGLANQGALAFENARLRALEEARADQLATILEDLSNAVCACDARKRITVVNAATRALYGTACERYTPGDDVVDFLTCAERTRRDGTAVPVEQDPLLRALAGERVQNEEYGLRQEDGTARTVLVSARPIYVNDVVAGAVSVARDVTAEREAEERDARRLAQLEQATTRANAIADVMLAVNAGTTEADVLATAITELVDKLGGENGCIVLRASDRHSHVHALDLSAPAAGVPRGYDVEELPATVLTMARPEPVVVTRDEAGPAERILLDRFRATSCLVVPLTDGDHEVGVGCVTFAEPRTSAADDLAFAATLAHHCAVAIEKAQLIEASESAHRRLLAVLDQLPHAVLIIAQPQGEVVIANAAAEQLWGVALDGGGVAAGTLPFVNEEGRTTAAARHPLLQTLQTGKATFGEPLTVRRADGTLVEVLANHAPILDGGQNLAGAVSLLQDRAHFKPLDRAKDEFLSVVAHELRTPLTALRGNLQLLERRHRARGAVSPEEERARLTTIIGQVDRLTELVSRLLDISRPDLGKQALSFAAGDAAALVRAAALEARGIAADRSIQVTVPEQAAVMWDTVRVEQILANLLSNAVRYAPDGAIDVTLDQVDGDALRIAVRDYGPGVPPHIQRRLFTRYYRFDDSEDDRHYHQQEHGQGLGIGLYISARLARAHGGALTVADAPGGGALFVLTLPRDAAGAAEESGET